MNNIDDIEGDKYKPLELQETERKNKKLEKENEYLRNLALQNGWNLDEMESSASQVGGSLPSSVDEDEDGDVEMRETR